MEPRLGALLAATRKTLATTSDSPDLDARRLLQHVLGVDAAHLIVHAERTIDADARARLEALVARRLRGEPVAYLTGQAGFWSLDLTVTPDVLVPRPDTETLVEAALARLPRDAALQIADLGTGSGAIALALASECPAWRLTATDASAAAIAVTQANAQRLGIGNIAFATGAWYTPLAGRRFDAIVSNPPYIAAGDCHLAALDFEPQAALVAGDQGLADLARLARGSPAHLVPGGWLLLEHGVDQPAAVRHLLEDAGLKHIETVTDLAGRPRVTLGQAAA